MIHPINATIEDAFIAFAKSLLHLDQQQEQNFLKYHVPKILLEILNQAQQSCPVSSVLLETLLFISKQEGMASIIESGGIPLISRTIQYHNNDDNIILLGCQLLSNIRPTHKANAGIGNAISCLNELLHNHDNEEVLLKTKVEKK